MNRLRANTDIYQDGLPKDASTVELYHEMDRILCQEGKTSRVRLRLLLKELMHVAMKEKAEALATVRAATVKGVLSELPDNAIRALLQKFEVSDDKLR